MILYLGKYQTVYWDVYHIRAYEYDGEHFHHAFTLANRKQSLTPTLGFHGCR